MTLIIFDKYQNLMCWHIKQEDKDKSLVKASHIRFFIFLGMDVSFSPENPLTSIPMDPRHCIIMIEWSGTAVFVACFA